MDSCLDQLRQQFQAQGVEYEVIGQPRAATTQEASAAAGISGYSFAKPVVLMVDERPRLFVLRAADRVDTQSLRRQLAPSTVRIADEYETHPLFPGCESGGIPAVPLRGEMPVYIDGRLAPHDSIIFEAGSSTEAVRMRMADYQRLVQPQVLDFADEPQRRRRRVTRTMRWRERGIRATPFVAAIAAMAMGARMRRGSLPMQALALGLVAGATTSALTEPRAGGRRRALVRDKPRRWARRSAERLDQQTRYMGGHLRGLWHQVA